jgi:hypothetical protein
MFTVLATCQTLQVLNLKIGFHIGSYNITDDAKQPKLPGLAESKVAVRGIKKLTLDLLPRPAWYHHHHEEDKSRRNTLESLLVEEMAKPRGKFLLLSITSDATAKQIACCMPQTSFNIFFSLFLQFATRKR